MKIAVLSSHTPSLFWFRMDMMRAFQNQGHEVFAIGNEPECRWNTQFEQMNIRYREIQVQRNGINPVRDLETLRSIRRVLAQEKPDKLFTYQAKTVIYGGIAAKELGITEVYPLIAGLGSIFLQKGLKHSILRSVMTTEYRIGLKSSQKVFFQNQDDCSLFLRKGIVSQEKVVLIHGSGININQFQPTPLPEKAVFLCISRLIRDKGVGEYLEACRLIRKKYPDIRCLLVGPYDTNPSAIRPEELSPYLEDGTITYYGEQSDVRPYINQSSVFVLPSYREGTPKTVLEAMASGRAVITTDAPGCKETVQNGVNGFLVPVKDIHALADRMEELIHHPELVQQMAAKGREIAVNKYDVNLVNAAITQAMKL